MNTRKGKLTDFSIVTICYSNEQGLSRTYESLKPLLLLGLQWIVVVKNCSISDDILTHAACVIRDKDNGLYSALNLGLNSLATKRFMFLHCEDIINSDKLLSVIGATDGKDVDVILGGAQIGNRTHLSKWWKPWMFQFYVQPPHLPIIYHARAIRDIWFNENLKIVSDFYFLKELFSRDVSYFKSNEIYVNMATGGATTSGFNSLYVITKEFYRTDGFLAIVKAPLRIMLKFIIK